MVSQLFWNWSCNFMKILHHIPYDNKLQILKAGTKEWKVFYCQMVANKLFADWLIKQLLIAELALMFSRSWPSMCSRRTTCLVEGHFAKIVDLTRLWLMRERQKSRSRIIDGSANTPTHTKQTRTPLMNRQTAVLAFPGQTVLKNPQIWSGRYSNVYNTVLQNREYVRYLYVTSVSWYWGEGSTDD